MRRNINILWVEDELKTRVIQLQNVVKKIIEDSLYEVEIFNANEMQCLDFSEHVCASCASNDNCNKAILRDYRIDIIFSDNNLNGEEGVDFLTKLRSLGGYKYYILYSNLDENQIVEKITDRLNKNRKVHLFSNFDFLSLSNWEDRIDDSMEAFLNNRSKMDELRNIYIVENSIIEDNLTNKDIQGDYFTKINTYCQSNGFDYKSKMLWHGIRKDRNILAHGTMSFSNGLNIVSNEKGSVNESDFEEKMKGLKKLTETLIKHDNSFYK